MRHLLISALFLSLLTGCSSLHIGPHHIDVQQGNALDQESVSRLKIGLNRSQVRFLLGTPLIIDPFRTDRWDYVYLYYKAGKLTEQKHITLFFDGDTLARIEGDLPGLQPGSQPAPAPKATTAPPLATELPATSGATATPPSSMTETSIVPPLASPQDASVHAKPQPASESSPKSETDVPELSLKPETDVTQIKPDDLPPSSGTDSAVAPDAGPVLKDSQP